jgi:hypothetical protein
MTVSGTDYSRKIVTYSGIDAYAIYISGTNYSRVELYNFDGIAYDKPMMSGVYEILNYVNSVMPSGTDSDTYPDQWFS